MTRRQDKPLPEAGADTVSGRPGRGARERDGDSGGTRTGAGGTYGDFVPERVKPQAKEEASKEPESPIGEYDTGGGNIDRAPAETAARQPSEDEDKERIKEDRANKDFDTPHVHSSTTSRKV